MSNASKWTFLSVIVAIGFLSIQGGAQPATDEPHFVPNQVLVQFRADSTPQERANARARANAVREQVLIAADRRSDGRGDLELLRIPPGRAVADAVRGLQAERAVEFAEPNWIYERQLASNDTYYTNGSLWGMYGDQTTPANQYGSHAGEAWAAGHVGTGVFVGVIDEGIMPTHEDLDANIFVNPGDSTVDGVDNDGNGYVDDIVGWDFASNDNTPYDGTSDDHATHVAGTIGAEGGNAMGVAGVNWNVKLISAKFLGRAGGTTANAVLAVQYLTDLKLNHGIPIVASNNSWGGGGESTALKNAIDAGCAANILFIAAAGNGGRDGVGDDNDARPSYPASYTSDCIIAVASITSTGTKSGFSNYGLTSVDIGAPGSAITSTLPGKFGVSKYGSYSGTSMATPHVTGAAALYASTHPGATAAQIKSAILNSAVPTASLAGKTVTGGRLNVAGF